MQSLCRQHYPNNRKVALFQRQRTAAAPRVKYALSVETLKHQSRAWNKSVTVTR